MLQQSIEVHRKSYLHLTNPWEVVWAKCRGLGVWWHTLLAQKLHKSTHHKHTHAKLQRVSHASDSPMDYAYHKSSRMQGTPLWLGTSVNWSDSVIIFLRHNSHITQFIDFTLELEVSYYIHRIVLKVYFFRYINNLGMFFLAELVHMRALALSHPQVSVGSRTSGKH